MNQNKESHVHIPQSPKENKNIISNKSYLFRLKGKLIRIIETIHYPHGTRGKFITSVLKPQKGEPEGQVQEGNEHTASTYKTKGYAPGKIKSLQQAGVGGTSEQSQGAVLCSGHSTKEGS